MRPHLLAAALAITLMLALSFPGVASAQAGASDYDDSRVPVQLVVFGAALLVVLGVGTLAYMARKKFGLDGPPPPEDTSSHH